MNFGQRMICSDYILMWSLYTVYTVLRIDSREARGRNRIPRLEVIIRSWFDWSHEIWKKGSGKEKLNTGYIFKASEFSDSLNVGYEIRKGERITSRFLTEYLGGWSCYEWRWKDCRKSKFRMEQKSRFVHVKFEIPLQLEEELWMWIWITPVWHS